MVQQEIEKAIDLFQKHGQAILKDQALVPLINQYQAMIDQNFHIMSQVGIIEACTSCASQHVTGCCFSGVEEWYDAYLLLINLLLSIDLPEKADFPKSCLFVGEKGCKLKARHAFCVNYLCPDLRRGFDPDEKKALSKAVGVELQAGWELEKALRNWIKDEINHR